MNEQECLKRMVAPGTRRPGKYREGVIQIHVTRACNQSCYNCTQGSNLGGKTHFMSPKHFEQAVQSLKGYFGVVGVFGGNPAMSPHFVEYCRILREYVPYQQRGLWCNDLLTAEKGQAARDTFDPSVSNLNVHMDARAYNNFLCWWPESRPFGLREDSRHSPPWVAMKDVVLNAGDEPDESRIWELISGCDINQHWSAMIGVFRGELRAWFCEIAGAQSILHQDEPDYPDTGIRLHNGELWIRDIAGDWIAFSGSELWWTLSMQSFAGQVRKHCFDCGVPLRGYGALAQGPETQEEQTSATHASVFVPKRKRTVQIVTELIQLDVGKIAKSTQYLQNARS